MTPRLLLVAGLALGLAGPLSPAACRAQDEKSKTDDKPKPDAKPDDPSEILKAIAPDLQANKIDAAIEKLDKMVKDKPKDRMAVYFLCAVTQQKATVMIEDRKASIPVFLKSAEAARQLVKLTKDKPLSKAMAALPPMALYNGACSLALDKKPDEALTMLAEAVDAGFAEVETFEKDKEIDSLRDLPKFAEIAKKLSGDAVAEVAKLFKEHKAFPFSFSLPDLADKKVSLDDYKGKVVIVDIWGTWCPPCREEIPHFIALHKDYNKKGLEIVGINYEDGAPDEVKKVIKDFLAENKVPYTCVIGDEKTQKQVPDFEGYPTTLFLDRTGKVRLKVVGGQSKAVLEAIVKTLMDEKAE